MEGMAAPMTMAPGIGGSMTPAPGYIPDAQAQGLMQAADAMGHDLQTRAAASKDPHGSSLQAVLDRRPAFGPTDVPDWLQDYMEPERTDPDSGMPIGPNYGTLMVDRAGHQKYSLERERLKALKEQKSQ
jgi:hypothetical protein